MKSDRVVLCVLTMLSLCGMARGSEPFAEAAYEPPMTKTAYEALVNPIAPNVLAGYLAQMDRFHVYDLFAGQASALKAKYPAEKGQPLKGGEEVPLTLEADELFGTPIQETGGYVYLGSIQSLDAEGVRLQVDLSGLDAQSQVWIVDPSTPQAFGPYTPAVYSHGAFWLASVFCDESVIMVRTPKAELPKVRVVAYAHLFLTLKSAALSCNISVACENSAVRKAASATAVLSIGTLGYCSGTLINNPKTATNEPLLITANHCICTAADARDTEAFWDFRESACKANDAGSMSSRAHSSGTKLLATSSSLDSTLIMLDSVPSGTYGRAYVGWSTRPPAINDDVICIHYPQATYNRVSFGRVEALNVQVSALGYVKQTEMVWDEGVTEQGSSGSCVLFADDMQLFGTLSNGADHTCGSDRSGNIDMFSSFKNFYEQVKDYVDSATPSTAEGADDCGDSGVCTAKALLNDYPELLNNLRLLRDKVLLKYAVTAPFVKAYYAMTPQWLAAVRESSEARGIFLAVVLPIANVAGKTL